MNLPTLAQIAAWAAGRGLLAVNACGLLVLLTVISLIRIAARRWRTDGFQKADDIFLAAFRDSAHVLALFQDGVEFRGSPRWQVYLAGCRELAFHLIGSDRVEKNFTTRLRAAGRISISQMATVRRAMERAAGEIGLDYLSVTTPPAGSASTIRWVGVLCGMAVFAGTALGSAGSPGDLTQPILHALLPVATAIVLSLVASASAGNLLRRITTAGARLQYYPAELSIMVERAFVDHAVHPADLPSVAALGAPVFPGFNLPPSDGFTRSAP